MSDFTAFKAMSNSIPIVASIINNDAEGYDFMLKEISEAPTSYVFGLAALSAMLIHSLAELTEETPSEVLQEWAMMLSNEKNEEK